MNNSFFGEVEEFTELESKIFLIENAKQKFDVKSIVIVNFFKLKR